MISSEQVRAGRALLNWQASDLAHAAKLSLATIERLEAPPGPLAADASVVEALRGALEAAGLDFIDENGGGMGVRLKRPDGGAIAIEDLNASNDE